MGKKDYKIEKRPTLWNVIVSRGEYSDYTEDHFLIRGNSPEEAKEFFKRFWKGITNKNSWHIGLVFNDGEKYSPYKRDIDWDTAYGDASDVNINMAEIICFKK